MADFLDKIKEYLEFVKGPTYLLFMSEAGRCEYFIFSAVHLAMVIALAREKQVEIEASASDHILQLADCYYRYFCEGKLSQQEKCRQENQILVKYLQENLQLGEISPEKLRQWKKRALQKDPLEEIGKIIKKRPTNE